ncbi:MAG: hypothetical protein WCO06_00740 [Candidatus Roizmanbacteria bacterium]
MKSRTIIFFFIVSTFLFVCQPARAQGASNCGIPYTGVGDPNPIGNYACCGSEVELIKEITNQEFVISMIGKVPVVGDILTSPIIKPAFMPILNIINPLDFPKAIIPFWPLGTIGDRIKAWGLLDNSAGDYCNGGVPIGKPGFPGCYCRASANGNLASIGQLCRNITTDAEQKACFDCIGIEVGTISRGRYTYQGIVYKEGRGVWTAMGCMDKNLQGFVQNVILGYGIGLSGLFAFLCVIYGGFQYSYSRGNSEKIKKAQELLTSCLVGLLFIIFSVLILRIIGVDLLRIPGLS